MESVQRITTDVEKELNRTAKVCALPGAQRRGTWGTHLQWLCSLLPAPGPPALGRTIFFIERTGKVLGLPGPKSGTWGTRRQPRVFSFYMGVYEE